MDSILYIGVERKLKTGERENGLRIIYSKTNDITSKS